MITELKLIPDIMKRILSEMHARRFLEGIIWPSGMILSSLRDDRLFGPPPRQMQL